MPGRISRLVASFLRVVLVPTIVFGVPAWPLLGLLCAGERRRVTGVQAVC